MPRRVASGHRLSRQRRKLAAAARIAWRVISGWPEAPSSPLHSPGAEVGPAGGVEGAGTEPVDGAGANNERRSGNWAAAPVVAPATSAAAQKSLKPRDPIGIVVSLI